MRRVGSIVLLAACGAAPERDVATPTSAGTTTAAPGGSATGWNAQSSGSEPSLDLGAADDGGTVEGCQNIDFLFVIDNSSSMGSHQIALLGSFAGFMDTILDTVQAQDFNVMVADSDAGDDISRSCEPCPAMGDAQCGDWCTVKDTLDLECEVTLGAGEVAPYNVGASNRACGVPGDRRYLTAETSHSELKALFACMANVGIRGSTAELPMSAMIEAITAQSIPGGCNEGFVRDDAILVVTIITDDYPVPHSSDDASTIGAPKQWYDAVVAAKNGAPENVVMLGIINTADALCVSGTGDPITHPTPRFVEFVDHFGKRGLTGNICNGSYSAFFEEAVALIDTTCDEYVPEG